MAPTPVVTCFLRAGDDVLLVRRSYDVGTYRGRWGAVSGHVEPRDDGDRSPAAAARAEVDEETGLLDACELVRAGEPFAIRDTAAGRRWRVHPFLFDCASRDVIPNEEAAALEWVPPTEILRRRTVPALWTSYDHVRPTVGSVAGDATHGSAYLSLRALDVLRDRAGEFAAGGRGGGTDGPAADGTGGDSAHGEGADATDERAEGPAYDELAGLARNLVAARPDMAAVANRVNRAMTTAASREPGDVEASAQAVIEAALDADDRAAAAAADLLAGRSVLTLSRSGTVGEALQRGEPERVVVAESRPGGEGVGVAESLAADGLDVTLVPDAAVARMLAGGDVDLVLVGADAVGADGSVVNKVGTLAAAIAAARADVPVYAVAARDKISPAADRADAGDPDGDGPAHEPTLEEQADPGQVYDGDADLAVEAPLFDRTPADLVDGVVTEDGVLDAEEIRAAAEDHARLRRW